MTVRLRRWGDHRRDRAAMRVAYWLPEAVMTAPERVALALGQALVGVNVLIRVVVGPEVSVSRDPALVTAWGVTLLLAGTALLIGMFGNRRPTEHLGLGLSVLGGLTYFVTGSNPIVALVFLAIAAASAVRLVVSAASRAIAEGVDREVRAGGG